jgi:hypothetical protein
MDRKATRRELLQVGAQSAERELELLSRAKMWEAEANRAEVRVADLRESLERQRRQNPPFVFGYRASAN